jgi:hypothetical protein
MNRKVSTLTFSFILILINWFASLLAFSVSCNFFGTQTFPVIINPYVSLFFIVSTVLAFSSVLVLALHELAFVPTIKALIERYFLQKGKKQAH